MSTAAQNKSNTTDSAKLVKLSTGVVPPQALELERSVLGALLVDDQVIHEVQMVINTSEAFYSKQHQVIYSAVMSLSNSMSPIDLLTVSDQLRKDGNIEIAGGDMYLVELSQMVASSAHIEYHCRIVMQKFVARQTIKLASTMVNDAYSETTDVLDLLAQSTNELSQIQDLTLSGARQLSMSEALVKVRERVEFITNQDEGAITGVTSGLTKIDKFTSGWQPGAYITIGARPGMGKTSLLVGNMVGAAKQGLATGFVSLEMTTEELVSRSVAVDSSFHLSQLLTKGFEKPEYFTKLMSVTDRMQSYKCFFNDSVKDISDIIATARKWKRDNNIGILFIDYLQLITDKSVKSTIREQEIASITRKLKSLAKELKVPVIVPCQLSREVEKRGGSKRPLLSDLRESGAIEQDSDIVAFLYRPDYYGIEPDDDILEENCNSEFIFSKFRAGGTGVVPIFWKGDKTKFYNHSYIEGVSDALPAGGVTPAAAFGNDDDLDF